MKLFVFIFTVQILNVREIKSTNYCPNSNSSLDCGCQINNNGDYEILCPKNDTEFIISISINGELHVKCIKELEKYDQNDILELIPQIPNLNNLVSLNLYFCPVKQSFSKILNKFNLKMVPQTVSVTFSQLRNLNSNFFANFSNITNLEFSDNDIGNKIPDNFLNDLVHLKDLVFRSNNISEVPANLFLNNLELEYIEFGDNSIVALGNDIFQNLHNLTGLGLWRNNLTMINDTHFKNLINLRSLDLSSNEIFNISQNAFRHLINLEDLNLFRNKLKRLPDDIFQNNIKLRLIKLDENSFETLPRKLFAHKPDLVKVSIASCKIQNISEDSFWGSPNLNELNLSENNISELPNKLFRDSTELESLNLANNNLSSISDQLFSKLKHLKELILDSNKITKIEQRTFENLQSLKTLSIDNNGLVYISNYAFNRLINLETISLRSNKLALMNNNDVFNPYARISPFQNLQNLEVLDLAYNEINEIFDDWRVSLTNLRELDLSFNNFTYLEFSGSLHFQSNNLHLSFDNNNITTVDFMFANVVGNVNSLQDARSGNVRSTKVTMNNNPIVCDCKNYHFFKYLEGDIDPVIKSLVEINPGNLTCTSPPTFTGRLITTVSSNELACDLPIGTNHVPCPKYCSCFVKYADTSLTIDCSHKNYTHLPISIPQHSLFNNTIVDFSFNKIQVLPHLINYENVTELILTGNQLQSVESLPKKIKTLYLDKNQLEEINVTLLNETKTLEKLYLNDNRWQCYCNTSNFLNYIWNNFIIIGNYDKIVCENKHKLIQNLTISELCPISMSAYIAIVIIVIVSIVAIAMVILYYHYEESIKVWLFAHKLCLWLVTEEELDKDKQYDAFVSYSHQDEAFVVNELIPNLEINSDPPFKLCIHFRDWMPGEFIPDQIARSVESSRRTLVVLTPDFLKSVWGKMEFRSAHLNAISEGRTRVIIIKLKDIGSMDDLEPELKAYLTLNTYIEWGDSKFWDRLKYALPHPNKLSKKGKLLSEHIKQSLSDKIELIHSQKPSLSDSQTILTSCTTPPLSPSEEIGLKNSIGF